MADTEDFDGCSSSSCRPRNKPWQHTYAWGLCAHAPESARPEPRVTLLGAFQADDGGMSIGTTSYTVTELAAKIETALREVGITLGPKSLELLEGGHRMHLTGREYSAMALTVATMLAGEYP
ncbi:hypothetical protein [Streptacidiphilus sp. PAMC 29251]